MNVITLRQLAGKEIFWYDDYVSWNIVIGVRGGQEYRINRWTWQKKEDSFRLENGRNWNEEEALTWAFKYAMKESEYVDFEEVIESPKLLS